MSKTKKNAECRIEPSVLKVHPLLKNYFGYCLYKSAMRLRSELDKAYENLHLIAPQCGILYLLEHTGDMSQIALGDELGIDKTSMVKLIDGLEKNKLVERRVDTVDRRVKLVSITKKGLKQLAEVRSIKKTVEDEFLKVLTPEERKSLESIMPKLLR